MKENSTTLLQERIDSANKNLREAEIQIADAMWEINEAMQEVERHGDEYWELQKHMRRLRQLDLSDIELEDI